MNATKESDLVIAESVEEKDELSEEQPGHCPIHPP